MRGLPVELVQLVSWRSYSTSAALAPRLFVASTSAPSSSPSPSLARIDQHTERALTEEITKEYKKVPKGSLGQRLSARSPREALLSQLQRRPEAAQALLDDLLHARADIEPDIRFAKHAIKLYRDGAERWLSWWEVAHSRPFHRLAPHVKRPHWNRQLTAELLRAVVGETHKEPVWSDILAVARVSAPEGHWQLVAKRLCRYCASFAPLDVSEELWSIILSSHRAYVDLGRQLRPLMASPGKLDRGEANDLHFLRDTRSAMIRAHVDMGRLDVATRLALVEPNINDFTLLSLLETTAAQDRFDLFRPLYELLEHRDQHLETFLSRSSAMPLPYVVRQGSEGGPPAQEAFVTFRYSDFTSPLEEEAPSVKGLPIPDDISSLLSTFTSPLSAKPSQLPPLAVATALISKLSASNEGVYANLLISLNRQLLGTSAPPLRRAYWATAMMLERIEQGAPVEAVRLFVRYFHVAGSVPPAWLGALAHVIAATQKPEPMGRLLLADTHTLTVFAQALVESLSVVADGPSFIPSMYDSLVDSARSSTFNLLQRSGASPDATSLLPFLRHFASSSPSQKSALDVFDDMASLDLVPHREHWGVLLGSLARQGDVETVFSLLDLLEGRDEETEGVLARLARSSRELGEGDVDIKGYTAVIEGFRLKEDFDSAWEAVRRFAKTLPSSEDVGSTVDDKFKSAVGQLQKHKPQS